MKRTLVVGVTRERRFSPGKVEDDAAIFAATADRLRSDEIEVEIVDADGTLPDDVEPALVFAMCQGEEALAWLDRLARRATVVNSPAAIRACHRVVMAERLADAAVPQPAWTHASEEFPRALGPGPWLKRGDVHAMEPGDVRRVFDERDWREARREFALRGISRAIVQAHAEGPVYKFYGVTGGFFRAFGLPAEFAREAAAAAAAGARALGLEVYGGDGVCLANGRTLLIDVNDWPSFSRCRDEAAVAIARRLGEILQENASHVPSNQGRPPRTQVP